MSVLFCPVCYSCLFVFWQLVWEMPSKLALLLLVRATPRGCANSNCYKPRQGVNTFHHCLTVLDVCRYNSSLRLDLRQIFMRRNPVGNQGSYNKIAVTRPGRVSQSRKLAHRASFLAYFLGIEDFFESESKHLAPPFPPRAGLQATEP